MSTPKIAIVIPARMDSSRFPGKPLANLAGKPMIQWVAEAAKKSGLSERVIVATPDQAIIDVCEAIGVEVMLTRSDHPSGTDRIAEVSTKYPADIYVNVQGDEPLIDPATIRSCALPLIDDETVAMASIFSDCSDEEMENPAVVKVVTDKQGFALYFSRFPLPYPRNQRSIPVKKHVGIYAFRGTALAAFANWPTTPLEESEGLEQLRFLENGVRIQMSAGQASEMAVDTPEQAQHVAKVLQGRQSRD